MPRQPSVAIYARVSTSDKQTPDAQLRDLRQYARNRNWHGVEEFVDIGESGSKDIYGLFRANRWAWIFSLLSCGLVLPSSEPAIACSPRRWQVMGVSVR